MVKNRQIAVRLPEELLERLQAVASSEYRSVASVVAEACDRLISEREARQ